MTMRKGLLAVGLAAVALSSVTCSDAPQLVLAANRIVLAEVFSNIG
jgi:hypothetical protein